MSKMRGALLVVVALLLSAAPALADKYDDTISVFKGAGESSSFFGKSYGYAVFPDVGKGGLGIGGAYGKGRVYEKGKYVGDTSMVQLSVGFQAGGEDFSQIVFFEDKRAFDEFTTGQFEFGANVGAVVISRVSQGHGRIHHYQGWSDVRGVRLRAKILVRATRKQVAAGAHTTARAAMAGAVV